MRFILHDMKIIRCNCCNYNWSLWTKLPQIENNNNDSKRDFQLYFK